jgi:hypothetical protein
MPIGLVTSCIGTVIFIKHVTEGKIEAGIEVNVRGTRRSKQDSLELEDRTNRQFRNVR